MRKGPRPREAGYALLLVFLMAALLAIALYRELPRVSFESQRAKEQLLIERGEQYKRAIQLFVRKFNRYPATIEELENTNNIRFLRKRYRDPMTGKEKWRLIHINGGVLTDSIIQKVKAGQEQQQQGSTNTFIGEGPVMGAGADPGQQQFNPALRRRASDDKPAVTQEVPDQPEPSNAEITDTENNDNTTDDSASADAQGAAPVQPAPSMPPGRVPFPPGMTPPGMTPAGYPGQTGYGGRIPGQAGFGGQPGAPGQPFMPGTVPGSQTGQDDSTANQGGFPQPSYPGQAANPGGTPNAGVYPPQPGQYPQQPGTFPPGQQPGQFPQPGTFPGQQPGGYPQQAGAFPGQSQGFGQPASPGFGNNMGGANGPNAAALAIQNSLNGPRPGGLQGLPGMGGTQMGGGIAGVASESLGPAIIVYNERKKYNEWEFVYDQSKDRGLAGVSRGGGAPGTAASQMGNIPGSPVGQQPGGTFGGSTFGGGSAGGSTFGGSTFGGGSTGGSTFGQSPPQPPPPPQPPN